jgi:tRNA threonylcarbamoyladenosine biosynthesis protein TsaB
MGGLLLAVETATPLTSVALLEGDTLVCEVEGERGRPTAEVLLPAIDALFAGSGATLAQVEAFGVSIGPGSFTSLRIGLATLKGLAFGSPRLAVGVPTLAALALGAPEGEGPAVAMLDARRDEVYAGCSGGEGGREELPSSVYRADELAALLPPACRLVGEGAGILGERLVEALGPAVQVFPDVEPRAVHVGRLAAAAWLRGEGEDPAGLVPRYLRRAQAEVVRTGQALE